MPDEIPPPGYRQAGTVTLTFRFSGAPFSVRGPFFEHEICGCLVPPGWTGMHERDWHPEAAEEA